MSSQTIVLAMLNESGHLNPTYKLARALGARGHDVRYLAVHDVRAQIEAQGFAVELLFPALFPAGALAAQERLATLPRRRAITRRYQALLERLRVEPPLDLARVKPALMLIDITQTHIALWARRAGVPFIYLNTSLPQTKDPGVPPLRTSLPFGEDAKGRVRSELAWRSFMWRRQLGARAAGLGGMCPPYELARVYAPRFGVALSRVDAETVYMPQLRDVPELVLCPQAFDFPRPLLRDRYYIESVDLERSEVALDPGAIPAGKPLVYCSLGGQRYRPEDTPLFFARLLRVMAQRPGWHLLLSVGKHVAPDALREVPSNVTVVASAPQLSVLRQARVMITHGGLGSVKECITNGVPMVVCPLDVDQPGNAARVEYHGIGLRGDVAKSTEADLLGMLDRVLSEPSFQARCAELRRQFHELEEERPGAAIVERYLA